MTNAYVVVSGIPGSGKSTIGREVGRILRIPVLDKDDFLERLFPDAEEVASERRRVLSRESDAAFCRAAAEAAAAVLVSFWHVPGMPATSGTPTGWLSASRRIVSLHCVCAPTVAAERFLARIRHPAHGDQARTRDSVVEDFELLARLGAPALPNQIHIDTTEHVDLQRATQHIHECFTA